ncbi:MAG: hypothetical protein B6I19_11640 [Bacteroidetes bacterium 4572_114]|nr:MAG: hypothetical protein B6I19_11640 [Bacteroidetes bacterium 4572_114]
MNPFRVIDSADFYISNHRTFACTDCHSPDYEEFPHDGSLRMEPKYTCMDCYEDDENFAEFRFEDIVNDFENSVHAERHGEVFTCWMCHKPHSYRTDARTSESVVNTVAYSNGICLTCHAYMDMYQYLSDDENPIILSSHDWPPKKEGHFAKVRCIECHSSNSLLMASLYNFQSIEQQG